MVKTNNLDLSYNNRYNKPVWDRLSGVSKDINVDITAFLDV